MYEVPAQCHHCQKPDTLKLYGLTVQKTEQWIQQHFNISPLIVQSETVSSLPKINRLSLQLEQAQVIIGTNIIAKS